jgi:protein-S-isoprenylcysteine O-methyltransferase Ste14
MMLVVLNPKLFGAVGSLCVRDRPARKQKRSFACSLFFVFFVLHPLADGRFTAMAIFIVQGVLAFTIGIISGSVKLSPERYTRDG